MSESEETRWRLGIESEQEEERAASPPSSDKRELQKEELQQRVQAKAQDIGGGGEGSLINTKSEGALDTDKKYEALTEEKKTKTKKRSRSNVVAKRSNNNLTNISKQLEKQANQLARIEKGIQPLRKSFNKIDRQSNTIKQMYTIVMQLQRQVRHQMQRQIQGTKNKIGKANIAPKK
jgi:hypothetical protein